MDTSLARSGNPYRPAPADSGPLAPFAGRQAAYEHLYRHLTDPHRVRAAAIMGRAGIGKTALLRHFGAAFDPSFVPVYVGLKGQALRAEADWLSLLMTDMLQPLSEQDLSLYRLPRPSGDDLNRRDWFVREYVPRLARLVGSRRVVLLLDDAETLIERTQQGVLPPDLFGWLAALLAANPVLGCVLAFSAAAENDLPLLAPLVPLSAVYRLDNLGPDDVLALLSEPVRECYALEPGASSAAVAATAGEPRLVQRVGEALFQRWSAQPERRTLTTADVAASLPAVARSSAADFRQVWEACSAAEQAVLTGLAQLSYADPRQAVNLPDLALWLAEAGQPLDETAVGAALRGLEYRQITMPGEGGARIAAGLLQSWLWEHAREAPSAAAFAGRRSGGLALAALAVALLVVLLLIALAWQPAPPAATGTEATVTLVVTPAS